VQEAFLPEHISTNVFKNGNYTLKDEHRL